MIRKFKTEQRLNKIIKAAKSRQFSLTVVLENIHDPHNVSAIMRTCEAVGIHKIHLLYTIEKFPKLSRVSSASATKWVDTIKYNDSEQCIASLKEQGFKIFSSFLDPASKNLFDIDFTEKAAIIFGNENRGVSDDLKKKSDEVFYIPMKGMVQSLNVSVAVGVVLFEALKQRVAKGMYEASELTESELDLLIDKWCGK